MMPTTIFIARVAAIAALFVGFAVGRVYALRVQFTPHD